MQETDTEINHQVTVILLKKIIELLGVKEEPLESVSIDNLDEVQAALQNNTNRQTKALTEALGGIKQTSNKQIEVESAILEEIKKSLTSNFVSVYVKKPREQVEILNLDEIPKEQKVTNLSELEPYFEKLANDLIGALKVDIEAPIVNVPAPIVNIPETVVNVPPAIITTDLSYLIRALEINLNKLRTNSETRPLAVRMSDGQTWVKQLEDLNKNAAQQVQFLSDVSYIKNASGSRINPATDESMQGVSIPSGAGVNGTVDLTSANIWYAVPSTVPTSAYELVATIESAAGTIRWGYSNSSTPSATNGNQAPYQLTIRIPANQSIYFGSSSAGDDVNWTTKVI